MKPKISIIVPAYNEEGNIKPLLDDLTNVMMEKNYEIVIVNDNSSDNTKGEAEKYSRTNARIRVLNRNSRAKGMGFSLIDGSMNAKGEIIVWVMADMSDRSETILRIIDKLDSGYDMVIGSRYMKGGSRGELSIIKAMLSRGYTFLAGLVYGFNLHDITNAFRGFKKDVLNNIKLESEDFAISPESAIKAYLQGFRIGEVPTDYFGRVSGSSNFKLINHGVKYIRLLKYGFKKKKKK